MKKDRLFCTIYTKKRARKYKREIDEILFIERIFFLFLRKNISSYFNSQQWTEASWWNSNCTWTLCSCWNQRASNCHRNFYWERKRREVPVFQKPGSHFSISYLHLMNYKILFLLRALLQESISSRCRKQMAQSGRKTSASYWTLRFPPLKLAGDRRRDECFHTQVTRMHFPAKGVRQAVSVFA